MTRPLPSSARDHTGNDQLDRIWRAIQELERRQNESPLTRGRLLTQEAGAVPGSGLEFTFGSTRSIPHGLGRKARGFIEIYGADTPSAAHVRLRPVAHIGGVTSETHITVVSSASGTCWLWVF
jgi:hypothetical protein